MGWFAPPRGYYRGLGPNGEESPRVGLPPQRHRVWNEKMDERIAAMRKDPEGYVDQAREDAQPKMTWREFWNLMVAALREEMWPSRKICRSGH